MADRKIAIVGMAPASRDVALQMPRPEFEIWSLNTAYLFLEDHWDRWYEVHDLDWLQRRPGIVKQGYPDWLQKDHGRPIYVPQVDQRIVNGHRYPLEKVVERFGRRLPDGKPVVYFQSTIDWMLAHVLHEYVEEAERTGKKPDWELHVLGVDMALGTEYAYQRPSAEYWIGIALGMGIGVNVPDRADLLKIRYVYGLDTYDPVAKKMQARHEELDQQLQAASNAEAQARDRKMMVRGALEALNWLEQQRY